MLPDKEYTRAVQAYRDVAELVQRVHDGMAIFDSRIADLLTKTLAHDPAALEDGRFAEWDFHRRRCNGWRYLSEQPQYGLRDFQQHAQALLAELERQP